MTLREKGVFELVSTKEGGLSTLYSIRSKENAGPKTVFFMIPGNPGILEYYVDFCAALFCAKGRAFDVFCVAHPGHSILDFVDRNSPGDAAIQTNIIESWNLYFSGGDKRAGIKPLSLKQQTLHKIIMFDHVKAMYPEDTTFIVCGHSIGSYMALNLLKERPCITKAILLFPTIHHIFQTPNGQTIGKALMFRHVIASLFYVIRPLLVFFPIVLYSVVSFFTGMVGQPLYTTCERLLYSDSIFHATTLGQYEMDQVKDLDVATISKHHDKLIFYYGPQDRWADESHFRHVKDVFPDIQAYLCTSNVPHDFVVRHSETMARKVAKWI